ncbi:MAG TPA: hypothetical protein DEQ45_18580 [Agrobacterium sp.]|nr:hypothetical protein [Agrobacterium sp.]
MVAHFQKLSRATFGHPEAQPTDISAVMAKIEEIVLSFRVPEDRLPVIGLYFSCKFIAPQAQRSVKCWIFGAELQEPSLPGHH